VRSDHIDGLGGLLASNRDLEVRATDSTRLPFPS
jgi:hypothetical protein